MYFRKWIKISKNNIASSVNVELNKLILKSLLSNGSFNNKYRFYFYFLLKHYSKYTSISIFRRFCNLTGYSKSVFRYFKLSRHQCKRYASDGALMGMRKSSF